MAVNILVMLKLDMVISWLRDTFLVSKYYLLCKIPTGTKIRELS